MPIAGIAPRAIKAAEAKPTPAKLPAAPKEITVKGVKTPAQKLAQLPMMQKALGEQSLPKARAAALPRPSKGSGGGLSFGTILSDLPKELQGKGVVEEGVKSLGKTLGAVETKGYENLLGKAGKTVGEVAGNTARDIVELPAQVLPTLYVAGKAAKTIVEHGAAGSQGSAELRNLVHSYLHESAPAQLVTGHPLGALNAAKRNPVFAAMEVSGGAGALDRAAGAAARAGAFGEDAADATRLADKDATNVSRQPQSLLGNTTAPSDPYSKRLTTRLRQGGQDPTVRPGESLVEQLKGENLGRQLVKHYDRQTATLENVRRASRSEVLDRRMSALKGEKPKGSPSFVPIPGHAAVNPFARGLLADPKVIDPDTGLPLYRTQLSRLVSYHAKPVDGELPFQAANRMGKVAEYQAMLDDNRLERNPLPAHKAAVKYAQDMRKIEPELVKHQYVSPQSMRVAKLADPFQFHWDGQDPQFDAQPPLNAKGQEFTAAEKARADALAAKRGTSIEVRRASVAGDKQAVQDALARHKANVAAHKAAVARVRELTPENPEDLHESPFSVAAKDGSRTHIPIGRVERELLQKHGVDPDNIGFVSNRPYQNESAAYYRSNTEPTKAGFNPQKARTGGAFRNGQYDTSEDALTRQHLTNQGLVDQARGSKLQVKTYALTKEHLAKLLEEKPVGEHDKPAVDALISELRSGSTFFENHPGSSAWDDAERTIREVERVHPDLKLTPGRVAHPFAPAHQLDAIAKHTIEPVQDRLDPNLWDEDRGADRFPTDQTLQRLDSGPIGVYHKAIADRMKDYEGDTRQRYASLFRAPASWWRRANIAFSTKHVFGLLQELGIRAAVNKIGPLSYLRGRRLMNLIEQAAADPDFLKTHPEAELDVQRLKADVGGTVANQTLNLQRHIKADAYTTSATSAAVKAIRLASERKLIGIPLRVVKGLADAYSGGATRILQAERKTLEHPAQIAGLGKVANDEAHRIMGQSLRPFGAVTTVEKQMAEGMLDSKAIDHAAKQLIEFWGDWTSASPTTKKILAAAPFFQWFRNSLRFLYVTMPMHHPVKTALLTTLESATAQQRQAMGQGGMATEPLEAAEQGSIPIGNGYLASQQYYTPQGAVSGAGNSIVGLPAASVNLIFPEFAEAAKILTGSGPYGETLENSKKEPITNEAERTKLAALALLETFNPLLGKAAEVAKGGKSAYTGSTLWNLQTHGEASEDPIGKSLGVPPGLWNAFRPFRTSKERTETGEPRSSGGFKLPELKLPEVALPEVQLPSINLSR